MTDGTISSTCGYCSTGCNLLFSLSGGNVDKVKPNPDYPVNLGKVCPKGFTMLEHLKAPDRATSPYLKNGNGKLEPVGWERAFSELTASFKKIQERHGKESVAFLSTGQISSEEFALLGTVAKFGMGILHGDGNTRQCMATAVVAYKQAFGFDAPPFTYKDFEESDVLVFVGANVVIAHPIMWNRVKMNGRSPEIVVIDPRKTEMARFATQHYPVRPKSDLSLLYGIANLLIGRGWIDKEFVTAHTSGFAELAAHVKKFTTDRVCADTGLAREQVEKLARQIHGGKRVSFYWTMGVNQSHQGVRTAEAIINLALITGNIGRAGTGPNSITGQCNAMGSRLFSNTASLFCGRDFLNPSHRGEVAGILGIDAGLVPSRASWAYDRILEGVREGTIRGLWIVATNPAHSWINKNDLFPLFEKLDYLVVQDMYHTTETAQRADLILPAAGAGEKDGTFINSERRFGVISRVVPPPGEAKTDFDIFLGVAKAWGCGGLVREWTSPEAAFEIMKRLSKGTPCDFSGIRDYAMIVERGGIQWPFPEEDGAKDRERRLFEDGRFFTPDGRAKLIFEDVQPLPEVTNGGYPFLLLTGRGTIAQWHTQTRTGKVPALKKIYPEDAYVEINPADARRLDVKESELVEVRSRRGAVKVKAAVRDTVPEGEVFMPMHYAETNFLTYPAFDPYSREPAYKMGAVALRRADM
jgi:anaerobic selenocysteine-containing dehydrogenase